jgi:hypothetical protein
VFTDVRIAPVGDGEKLMPCFVLTLGSSENNVFVCVCVCEREREREREEALCEKDDRDKWMDR